LLRLQTDERKDTIYKLVPDGSLNPKDQRWPVHEPSKTSGAIGFRPPFLFLLAEQKESSEKKVIWKK